MIRHGSVAQKSRTRAQGRATSRRPRSRRPAAPLPLEPRPTIIHVSEAHHLCGVQMVTRELCRSLGFTEAAVFQAVIAVSELAHRSFVEPSRSGRIELAVVPMGERRGLEVRTAQAGAPESSAEAMLSFPNGARSQMS